MMYIHSQQWLKYIIVYYSGNFGVLNFIERV